MDISKKDLLKETGISYGQLYRWKREGLIPEAWFIKKSSYTGQETFFPKEKILKRIHAIQQLKDKYSLEEMANLLSPEITNRNFTEEDLEQFEEIDVDIAASFMDEMEKDEFTFSEVLVMMVLSEWRLKQGISAANMTSILSHLMKNMEVIHSIDHRLMLIDIQGTYYTILMAEDATVKSQGEAIYFDDRMHIIEDAHLSDLSNTMKVKYKNIFNFEFDEEV